MRKNFKNICLSRFFLLNLHCLKPFEPQKPWLSGLAARDCYEKNPHRKKWEQTK